ncbi:hypothetical protein EWM64_g5424 [Hericium alpestre]|uniref:Uncharacterized protein n=1 Tax=Hericium alpestre TaxID=135208 RepID=A0A4Y9ZYV8_9AGAM|nr:hypothetical protein EWM64_g5424 [Hericium alpestre]
MASYLRSIFGYGNSSSSAQTSKAPSSSKSHSRARSQPTNYIYGPPGTASSTASASASSRPTLKKVHSNSASRSNTPSPLRYATFDSRGSNSHRDEHPRPKASSSHGHTSAPAPPPIYRRASYKHKEHHVHYPSFAPGYVTPGSSRSNSTSSLYPGATPMGTPMPLASSSHVNVNYLKDRRPVLKQNHTWSGVSTSASGSSSCEYDLHLVRTQLTLSRRALPPVPTPPEHAAHASAALVHAPAPRPDFVRHHLHALRAHRPRPPHALARPRTYPRAARD